MTNWTKMNDCKKCGGWPVVVPAGRGKKEFICPCTPKTYSSIDEWNDANPKQAEQKGG